MEIFTSGIIENMAKVIHTGLVKYVLENGMEIMATQDHPILTSNKGWCSLRPDKSEQYSGFENIGLLSDGDMVISQGNGNTVTTSQILRIEYLRGEYETYTITRLSTGNNFIANGFIVGTEDINHSISCQR